MLDARPATAEATPVARRRHTQWLILRLHKMLRGLMR